MGISGYKFESICHESLSVTACHVVSHYCHVSLSPHGRDGVTEDAAKPPVGERLEGPAEALGLGGAAPAGLLDGAVNTEALQAEPDTFYIELAVDFHRARRANSNVGPIY